MDINREQLAADLAAADNPTDAAIQFFLPLLAEAWAEGWNAGAGWPQIESADNPYRKDQQ